MNRFVHLSIIVFAFFHTTGASAGYPYELTAGQFLQMMRHPEPITGDKYLEREKAYSYLDGAKDATIGLVWCPPKPRKTFELAYDAADHIQALTMAAQKDNAAKILLTYLAEKYPCKKGVSQ